jgi:aldehyde dehydrogenase (NAD+)
MEKEVISQILDTQRKFFAEGKTLDIKFRVKLLKQLRFLIIQYEPEIVDALWKDFHKPEFEVISSETRLVISELNHTLKNLKSWSSRHKVRTPLVHFLSSSYILPQPYGQVLILSPWNFPFQLAFIPIIGALAAGNCVILKMSQQVPNLVSVIEKMVKELPIEVIAVANGDHALSDYLLDQKFDYIFFTGSGRIGKHVMKKAAENLTPVSLELGGKNPCVVAADAKLEFAARRIAWGKFMNGGQTCVCPDYVLIDNKVKSRFLELIKKEIEDFYGNDPKNSEYFCRVINPGSVRRLESLLTQGRIITGGVTDSSTSYVAPTVISDVNPGDLIMKEEIFGPVLPVIGYENFEEVYQIIEKNPKPLAAYIFSNNKKLSGEFLLKTQSGTAGVNDTVIQFASPYLPFGGVGSSGIGRYHGKKTFDTFSNMKSVIKKSNLFDIWLRYPPYSKFKTNIIRRLLSM